ncbi:adenylate cyclase [Bosea thiooxidans]
MQLDRILTSPEFNVPARVRQFLSYVVEQTLSGHADRIKAYSVAVEVFGRDANFDIQNDPVVRIEAGRLRRALERYYLLAGSLDRVLIEIPKGGYVPHFRWRLDHQASPQLRSPLAAPRKARPARILASWLKRPWLAGSAAALAIAAAAAFIYLPAPSIPAAATNEPTQPEGPSLVVRPFVNLTRTPDGDIYAAGLSEEILAQLARFKEITVFGRETSNALSPGASAPEIRRQFGSRYILEGSIRTFDGKLRVASRVLDGETSAIIWSDAYDADLRTSSIVDIETSIASKVVTAVAQPYGILFRTPPVSSLARPLPSFEAYQCSVRFYRYRSVLSNEEHEPTRDCLERIIARYPDHSTSWAMLSYLYLDEDRFELNRRPGSPAPVERARDAAQRAVRLDPQNVRALQALMTVLFFSKEPAEALRVGGQALTLNPNDAELLAEFGSRVAQAGDWKRGAALIEEALTRNPGHSDYYVGLLALAAYMQGDDERAVELIRRANLQRFSIYQFVAALIFTRSGMEAEAAQSRREFLKLRPNFFDDFDGELSKRNFNARDRAILVWGAVQAGFPVRSRLPIGPN